MKYSQQILTQRITEIRKYKAQLNKGSSDYKKLDVMEKDLTHATNLLAIHPSGAGIKHRTIPYSNIMNISKGKKNGKK